MNIPRYYFTCAVVDGLLYVIRGLSSHYVSILNAEVYNPKTNQWSLMDCPHRLGVRGFAVSFNSKLFVVGGNNKSCKNIIVPSYTFLHNLMMIIIFSDNESGGKS